ncbi:50S ribosomal protein L25 [Paenibacillus caui]|uniref:50S ribosomal protein L25 n=1 Tax=Paenibacillus caui TaxID=2873927 RepID=UPI001CAA3358|nr:50S ribosomal protein L25 [Paenibacillus caui]
MSSAHNVTLKAETRMDLSGAALHKLRESGRVPGVVYGSQIESQPVHVDEKELIKVSRTGRSEFFQLTLSDGKSFPALIKDIQLRRGKVAHVDFQFVSKNKPVRVHIPVHYSGTPAGTKSGGVLQTLGTELEVEGLPDDLPASIEVDVTSLGVGDKIEASEVSLPNGVTLHTPHDTLLVSIVMPRAADAKDEPEAADNGEPGKAEGATEETTA